MARHLIRAAVLCLIVLSSGPSSSTAGGTRSGATAGDVWGGASGDTQSGATGDTQSGATGAKERATADRIVARALGSIDPIHVVKLDTRLIAATVQAGRPVELPFVDLGNHVIVATVRLTPHSLRGPGLTVADLKNGIDKSYVTIPLPRPATYQGKVETKPGAAVLTIDERVVEGNILMAPDGWSIIEPLEPQLRQRGVDAQQRATVLKVYDHIVYNVRLLPERHIAVDADLIHGAPKIHGRERVEPAQQLVATAVADGDDAFYRAWPRDSVMPFWLKEETLFNSLDWLLNCIEPEADPANAYARCDNGFDGGHGKFQVRVQLDRLETWVAGGPNSDSRERLLRESARDTHQATPPCCGPPHTAGHASFVSFFSGRTLVDGAGLASVDGLAVYAPTCFSDGPDYLCHHALSQLTPGGEFPGYAFYQELLFAHEVGHIIGGPEQPMSLLQFWLFHQQDGSDLMASLAFGPRSLYLYREDDTRAMARLLQERLGTPHPAGH